MLAEVEALVKKLNESPGRMLPGVKIQPYYDRTDLIHVTTDTVRENLLAGMGLVTVVLFMFLTNVRGALIVAINIPLALLFAFAVLFLRGKSANLLSIGAVDFGIIVDSSVIIVENIYRHLSSGLNAELPIGQRIILASNEIQRCLFYSTAIMICAFLPLFTMSGPEGQIFGPMAETYAFALGGALLLALALSPVLCTFFLKNLKPTPRQLPGAGLASELLAAVAALHGPSLADPGLFRRGGGGHRGGAAVAGRRVHAGAGGREHLGPGAIPPEFLAGGSLRLVAQGPRDHEALPRDGDGADAGRTARRRHRSGRFLQCGILHAPETGIPVAGPAGKDAPAHQGGIDRRVEPGVERDDPLRGMELLAEHPQHGDGIDVGRARRKFGQDHRFRSGGIGTGGRPRGGRTAEDPTV